MKSRLLAEDDKRRFFIIARSNNLWSFEEETWQEGDEYSGPYFLPTYISGIYESEAEAIRDAFNTLPWLRDRSV